MGDSKYTDTGDRGNDPRHGFGDDMGTRVGRPDGAREAPRDANPSQQAGQPGTNDEPVAGGIEGSIMEGEGAQQRRVQDASVNPDRESGGDRATYDV